jgi:hypothetical protein
MNRKLTIENLSKRLDKLSAELRDDCEAELRRIVRKHNKKTPLPKQLVDDLEDWIYGVGARLQYWTNDEITRSLCQNLYSLSDKIENANERLGRIFEKLNKSGVAL